MLMHIQSLGHGDLGKRESKKKNSASEIQNPARWSEKETTGREVEMRSDDVEHVLLLVFLGI